MNTVETKEAAVSDLKNMVISLAHKYNIKGIDFEDLYQVGMMELLNALEHYDKEKGASLSSFAYIWIKGGMLKYIRENNTIKISKDIINLNRNINNTIEILTQNNMSNPTNEEIALYLGEDVEVINKARMVMERANVMSSDEEIVSDGKTLNIYDYYGYEDPGLNDEYMDLNDAVKSLTEEEQKIIDMKFYGNYSQELIAKEIGTNQVGVSRKLVKALGKLKSNLTA